MPEPSSDQSSSASAKSRGFAAFRYPDFRRFELARLLFVISWQMQGTTVAWQIYEMTSSKLALGFIGLVQFLPAVLLILVTGHVADRYDRKLVVATCMSVLALLSTTMVVLTHTRLITVPLIFALIFLIGTAHAFAGPASQALLPHLVPTEIFSNAVAWNSSLWQFASIAGPAFAGLLLALFKNPAVVYAWDAGFALTAAFFMASIRTRLDRLEQAPISCDTLFAGFRYVWQNKIILGAMTLDLFAVLLGGAV
ncbi:MAG: MFS transporter, partial [Candidatus Sumerlaeaceae bacterium]